MTANPNRIPILSRHNSGKLKKRAAMSIASRFLLFSGLLGLSGALFGQHGSHGGMHSGAVSAPHVAAPRFSSSPGVFVPAPVPNYPSASVYASAPNPVYRTPNYSPFRGPFQRGRYNRVLPYSYFATPFFPLWDYPDVGYSAYPAYSTTYDQPAPMQENNVLGEQIAKLSAQVNDLQNQIQQRAPLESPSGVEQKTAEPEPSSPPLTVVLTSGKTLQIQNYAVMDDALWDLSSQPVR